MNATQSSKRSPVDLILIAGVVLGALILVGALSGGSDNAMLWYLLLLYPLIAVLLLYTFVIIPWRIWNRVRRIDERLARIEALLEARMNRTAARPEQKDVR